MERFNLRWYDFERNRRARVTSEVGKVTPEQVSGKARGTSVELLDGWPWANGRREPRVRLGLALHGQYGGASRDVQKQACMGRALSAVGFPRGGAVAFRPGGAPTVPGDCAALALSHSGSWLLCAAALGGRGAKVRLGVDVECERPRRFEGMRRALAWPTPCDGGRHFYRRWTLAESLYKAVGPAWPASFDLLDEATRGPTRCFERRRDGFLWRVWWPRVTAGWTVCVVVGTAV